MFTGLIEGLGVVQALTPTDGDVRLQVTLPASVQEGLRAGDSLAVNGACLTVVSIDGEHYGFDVSTETLACTTLGRLAPGHRVNLERALRWSDRLGGHLVSGHVDAVGRVRCITAEARGQRWLFDAPPALHRYIAAKGSITVEGVSLTVNTVDAEGFGVMLIPHTVAVTTFGTLTVGDPVNLEVDLVARYLERLHARPD
ncbi:MAG: riboflavin synthase [Xanthomonadales bacterium]|nr:riboflavin synthase [Xanthomonadales bacterium]